MVQLPFGLLFPNTFRFSCLLVRPIHLAQHLENFFAMPVQEYPAPLEGSGDIGDGLDACIGRQSREEGVWKDGCGCKRGQGMQGESGRTAPFQQRRASGFEMGVRTNGWTLRFCDVFFGVLINAECRGCVCFYMVGGKGDLSDATKTRLATRAWSGHWSLACPPNTRAVSSCFVKVRNFADTFAVATGVLCRLPWRRGARSLAIILGYYRITVTHNLYHKPSHPSTSYIHAVPRAIQKGPRRIHQGQIHNARRWVPWLPAGARVVPVIEYRATFWLVAS
ncbi:hypothetical protein OG21DRAFT_1518101 [Imleria badia]|nr:hypothetical protein OG21DRAFT_1518101 [Imleria badia]